MNDRMDDSPPDMPLILHNKPPVSKAYADYMINYREHPLPAGFKHWHHSFHLGVHLEICNLPGVNLEIGEVICWRAGSTALSNTTSPRHSP